MSFLNASYTAVPPTFQWHVGGLCQKVSRLWWFKAGLLKYLRGISLGEDDH